MGHVAKLSRPQYLYIHLDAPLLVTQFKFCIIIGCKCISCQTECCGNVLTVAYFNCSSLIEVKEYSCLEFCIIEKIST